MCRKQKSIGWSRVLVGSHFTDLRGDKNTRDPQIRMPQIKFHGLGCRNIYKAGFASISPVTFNPINTWASIVRNNKVLLHPSFIPNHSEWSMVRTPHGDKWHQRPRRRRAWREEGRRRDTKPPFDQVSGERKSFDFPPSSVYPKDNFNTDGLAASFSGLTWPFILSSRLLQRYTTLNVSTSLQYMRDGGGAERALP